MREVAALAGVSLKTVSRVVNAEPGVTDGVRERVQRAALRLDYRPNRAASNLRRGRGRTLSVGVLLQDLSNSFSAALLRSLEDAARARGIAVLAASLDEDPEREQALVEDLVARRVDGLVLAPATTRQDYLAGEQRAGLPMVFVDRQPRGVEVDAVTVDSHAGALAATRHLLAHGHRRIACLTDLAAIPTAVDRVAGYSRAHVDAGVAVDPSLVVQDLRTAEAAQAALRRLLERDEPPTAVFAARNNISVGVVRALRTAGLSDRVAVVGYDDFPLADILSPSLTVVRLDTARIGALVGELLFARLDGVAGPPRTTTLTPSLVVRGSGEIPPRR
jgi:LacI family transcriptional regulator